MVQPMLELDGGRRGARSPGRVPADVLRGLEDGGVSVNHMQQIAIDMGTLLASQFPYPVMETRQHDAICHDLLAPVALPAERADEARRLAVSLADGVDAAGLLAVELFLAPEVLVNELALRPHNCGHLTIDACPTSQFDQHLRAIRDWPLGDTRLLAPAAAMVNVLGTADGPDPHTHLAGALAVPKPAFAYAPRYRGPAPISATSPP
jgi:formate-dependent phosphoribosylglycinamide formyltransferase (GAR transformylase)